jgi:hypothetical protein
MVFHHSSSGSGLMPYIALTTMRKGKVSAASEVPGQSNIKLEKGSRPMKRYFQTSSVDLLLLLAPTPDSSSLSINVVFR